MTEPALTEAVKTDLPSPKRNRRMWLALPFVLVVAAGSGLAAAYNLTRPHDTKLVWWTCELTKGKARQVRILIPQDWEIVASRPASDDDEPFDYADLHCIDRRSEFLQNLFPNAHETGSLIIHVVYRKPAPTSHKLDPDAAIRAFARPDISTWGWVTYRRSNRDAFNRTYRQICNSLTIE
jgi:hypothetical protein